MHILGLIGMPRRTYRYPSGYGWDIYNLLETVGAFVLALSVLIFIVNALTSRSRGAEAPDDPWDGRTLEWSIPSPPPEYNFAEIPRVEARDDFWHRKYTEDADGRLVRLPAGGADGEARTTAESDGHGGHVHMPSPSYFPLVMACGLPFLGYAAVFKNLWLVWPGVVILLFGLYAWAIEPASE
jgi:cytochrome c oxidase subunit 1